jgi:tryptophan-rich sensory protein
MKFLKSNGFKILITIISILIVAILGSVFVNLGMDWFNSLTTPSQWISNIVIPIVWTIIYLTFGIVLSIWITKGGLPRSVIGWLIANGVLNVIWCLVFFTLGLTFIGNIVIVLNLIAGIVLFLQIYKYKPIYAVVTAIYPIWLSLATTLNLAIWILN